MFVGVLRLSLFLPEPGSLKSKRHLLRSAIDRVKAKFNVSIAEVGDNDLWQRSVVGVAAVGNDHAFVNETLDKVADFIASMHGGQVQVTDRATGDRAVRGRGRRGRPRTLAEAEAEHPWESARRARRRRHPGAPGHECRAGQVRRAMA